MVSADPTRAVAAQHNFLFTQVVSDASLSPSSSLRGSSVGESAPTHQQHPKGLSGVPAPGIKEKRQKVSPLNTKRHRNSCPTSSHDAKTITFRLQVLSLTKGLCRHTVRAEERPLSGDRLHCTAQGCPGRDISRGFALCSVVCRSALNVTDIRCCRVYSAPGTFSRSFSLAKQGASNLS